MIEYKLYLKNAATHYLYIDALIKDFSGEELEIHLPAWRPGRYELGNFSKNIKKFEAFGLDGNALSVRKKTKDTWLVHCGDCRSIKVTYSYYAAELNAGSTFVDAAQLSLNPCNCLVYVKECMDFPHALTLDIPEEFDIATSLRREGKKLIAANFHELADSPVIASKRSQLISMNENGISFHLHFFGECQPQEEKIKIDFGRFIREQIAFFSGAHFEQYHFLFQILPYKFHHGVEHTHNTMIAFGPGYHLMHPGSYQEFLGLCCHEMFHTWNIKSIRPIEMLPYRYDTENYARTGFVYEGITTYYGDKLLFTSGVFEEATYFHTLEERITKHLHSFGRFNLSVGDSSFDNWLDGYTPGAPYRKTNIYDEGCLIAFMLDVLIIHYSKLRNDLRWVMKELYERFYKNNIGYSEADFSDLCSKAAETDLTWFFQKYVFGLEPYEPLLKDCFLKVGLCLQKVHALTFYERHLGIKAVEFAHHKKITMIAPFSAAWQAGLSIHDEIIAIEGFLLKNDFQHWLNYFSAKQSRVRLSVLREGKTLEIDLSIETKGDHFYTFSILQMPVSEKSIEVGQTALRWRTSNA